MVNILLNSLYNKGVINAAEASSVSKINLSGTANLHFAIH